MNIIEATYNQHIKMLNWCDINLKDDKYSQPFRAPFDNFKVHIAVEDSQDMHFTFKKLESNLYKLVLRGGDLVVFDFLLKTESALEYSFVINKANDVVKSFGEFLPSEYATDDVTTDLSRGSINSFLAVTNYFVYHKQDYTELEERERNVIKVKGRYKYAAGRNAIKLTRTYRLAKPVVTTDERNRIRREYKCEAWGVRGHIRHLKNGKTVFVRPYVKGKKRDEVKAQDKIYRF